MTIRFMVDLHEEEELPPRITRITRKKTGRECFGVRRASPLWHSLFETRRMRKENGKAAMLAALQNTLPFV
jgi:hypothetical protein